MSRATRALIRLSALRHNLALARQRAPESQQLAIIKANGYGHGIEQVAQALDSAEAFGVACLDEAIRLRQAGVSQPIVLLEGLVRKADLDIVRAYRLSLVVHQEAQLAMLEDSVGTPIPVWLKVDTGMGRLGFAVEQLAGAWSRLQACKGVEPPLRIMTHLANADDRTDTTTDRQLACFAAAVAGIDTELSVANSAGILGWPESHGHWNRPGIMLYGVSPFNDDSARDHGLRPVMQLQSELIAVNPHRAGDAIGYGGHWICPEAMPVGVVAIGYGDGYPRHVGPGTPVSLHGRQVPIIGTVSMDMLCVDLRDAPEARIGDTVELWGDRLPVETIARQAGTIGYELLCQVTRRVSFDYVE